MESGAPILGTLELRAGGGRGRRLRGRFPYGNSNRAVLSDGGRTGRPRKEVFAPRAFEYRVNQPDAEIHLLVGHDYDRPLASKLTGGLVLRDSAEALVFDADIAPEIVETSYFKDFWGGFVSGLVVGLSPGFRIPPPAAVPPEEAEKVEEEDPAEGRALIRTIFQALLFEISLVTAPAYPETEVEARTAARAAALATARQRAHEHLRRWRP
jgi:HK97 family phage prohead protease